MSSARRTRLTTLPLWLGAILLLAGAGWAVSDSLPKMATISGGEYTPLYSVGARKASVPPFRLAVHPVTNAQYLEFVRRHPEWRRSKVKRLFAESDYLKHWESDLEFSHDLANRPVTYVSWFAARAYCESVGGRLPTQDEWEFTARGSETRLDASDDGEFQQRILSWYAKPAGAGPGKVGTQPVNVYGVADQHGLVWEWVEDFNSILLTGESRADGAVDRNLFCAAGVANSTSPSNYAAYMRYAFRSSLKANYTMGSLGFRCAANPLPAPSQKGKR